MFDYLQQFNKLPQDLRERVSSPSAMAVISELENKYKTDLAATVMKVMVKSVAVRDLVAHLSSESGLASETAAVLAREMKEKIFMAVADYLGLTAEQRALDLDKDVEILIKEAGLTLPSAILVGRFKNILATYLRGVRSKIDTRNTLSKDAKVGGLNLSLEEIDRVFKICASHNFSSLATSSGPVSEEAKKELPDKAVNPAVPPRLAEIIAQADQAGSYDLKKSLASGQVKPPQNLPAAPAPAVEKKPVAVIAKEVDVTHELEAPDKPEELPAPLPIAQVVPPAPVPASVEKPSLAAAEPVPSDGEKLTSLPEKDKAAIPKPVIPVKPAVPVAKSVPKPVPVAPKPAVVRPAPAASPRPQMHDVRPMPKIMGPIEELQFLDVINFRRLGTTPAEAVNKIFAKIKLLEKDGYDKMVAGVKAWRQSPTNRLYIRLGQEAIAKGQSFREILAERQKAGQEHLSQQEVDAIVALNSKLVF